jgi:Na+-transporting methylmalonyl-CoA/oxaloacetate decarboxylase beta subunit
MKKIAGIILLLVAAVMLYLGLTKDMLPPSLTGIGFIVIGFVFLTEKNTKAI